MKRRRDGERIHWAASVNAFLAVDSDRGEKRFRLRKRKAKQDWTHYMNELAFQRARAERWLETGDENLSDASSSVSERCI